MAVRLFNHPSQHILRHMAASAHDIDMWQYNLRTLVVDGFASDSNEPVTTFAYQVEYGRVNSSDSAFTRSADSHRMACIDFRP